MSELKTPKQMANNLEYIISNPEQGSGSTVNDVIKYLTQDRAAIARVLRERVEGLKEKEWSDVDEIDYNQALTRIKKLIEETLTPQTPA